MRFFTKNIRLLEGIIALLFFIGASGVTAILDVCCCSEGSAHHMEVDRCLDPANMMEHNETSHESLNEPCSSPTSPTFVPVGSPCHTKITAGGLNSVLALLEKENKIPVSKLQIGNAFQSASDVFVSFTNVSKLYSPFSLNPSPPSVEKYVLNASFLI